MADSSVVALDTIRRAQAKVTRSKKRRSKVTRRVLYLAGPLFTLAERTFNIKLAQALSEFGHEVLLPQEFCEGVDSPALIALRCRQQLSRSEVVLINLDGADTDSGTAFEAGIAVELRKRTLGYRTDFRRSGDDVESGANAMFRELTLIIRYQGSSVKQLAEYLNDSLVTRMH